MVNSPTAFRPSVPVTIGSRSAEQLLYLAAGATLLETDDNTIYRAWL